MVLLLPLMGLLVPALVLMALVLMVLVPPLDVGLVAVPASHLPG